MGCPVVSLDRIARYVRRPEVPQPGTLYRQIGVRLWGQGAYERRAIDGSETKYATLYRTHESDIIVNKIWARNGSVAVVDRCLDGTFGSSEFPTYEIDRAALLPAWFAWYTRHPSLWKQCELLSRGTSGQNRLNPVRFLSVQLPLPSLNDQRSVVTRLDGIAYHAARHVNHVGTCERDTQAMLSSAFRKIVDGALRIPMARVAPLVRRPVEVHPECSYPEIGVRSFGRGTFHKPVIDGATVGSKRLFLVREGDLLFNIVFAWEGAVAVARAEDAGRVGSHRFLTCVPDTRIATSSFLHFYFLTQEGLDQLSEASPGGAGRNRTLGLKKLDAIRVPIPSIDRQRWFDRLQALVWEMDVQRTAARREIITLSSAVLHAAFTIDAYP